MTGAWKPGLQLAALAVAVAAVITLVAQVTEPRITANRYRASLLELTALSGESSLTGTTVPNPLPDDFQLCPPGRDRLRIVRGHAAGYGGDIEFLMAIDAERQVRGVRVTRHAETPGIGDAIETRHSGWILGLRGLPADGDAAAWRLRRDGGTVDAITGATITSRALIDGVRAALKRSAQNEPLPCPQ